MNGKKAKALRRIHGNPAMEARTYRFAECQIATGPRRVYRDAKKAYRESMRQ